VSANDQELVARRILEKFPGNSLVFTRDIPAFYDRGTPTLNAFLDVIVGLATVITARNILLSMHTAVTERTHEIGILKSLGASRVFIVRAVEQEALVISALGVAVGLLLAWVTRASIMGSTALLVQIEPRWIGIAAAVGLLGGAVGALYPALRAASADPIKALAHE
jgi:putative ABC transport system permease protein